MKTVPVLTITNLRFHSSSKSQGLFELLTAKLSPGDEFTGTFFVGVPEITTLPLLLYNVSMSGNYQIYSITTLILLVISILFML